jgi:hypothetical protein
MLGSGCRVDGFISGCVLLSCGVMRGRQRCPKRALRAKEVASLHELGMKPRAIAGRFKCDVRTIYRLLKLERRERPGEGVKEIERVPRLMLAFGASGKAYGVLECRDVHPCRSCGGDGIVLDLGSVLWRVQESDPVHYVVCSDCGGSGAAMLAREKSGLCCAVCHHSGADHLPALRPWPLPARHEAVADPTRYDPPEGLRGGQGR